MREIKEAASVLYAPALAEVIASEFIPDKPRVRGGILITFRDERGALVTIRLLQKAVGDLMRALEADPVAQINDVKSLPILIDFQPNTLSEIASAHDPIEGYLEYLPQSHS